MWLPKRHLPTLTPRYAGSRVLEILELRNRHCPGAPHSNGRFAMLGIELPTVWASGVTDTDFHHTDDGFWYAAPELKFTVPYSSVGYHVETKRGCEVWPAAPTPGAPRPLLAVYLGTDMTPLRKLLRRECAAASDCPA